jgi:HYR domain-containing protein
MHTVFRRAGTRRGRRLTRLITAMAFVGGAVVIATGSASASHITLPSSGSFLYMDSEQGDYIGGGIEHLYTEADTAINGSLSYDGNQFNASAIQPNYVHWWYVNFAAPSGLQLAVGTYESAVRWPFQSGSTPGLSIYGDGRGCNTLTGRFVVNELSRAPTGELLVFDADFEQHCEGGPASLRGRLRVEYPPPPPDVTAPSLNVPADITTEAPSGADGVYLGYSAWATDDRDPNPDFGCAPASGSFFGVGTSTVNCRATDDSGNTASGSFRVIVLPYLQMSIRLDSTGSVDSKTKAATLSGAVSCSRPLEVTVTGMLQQLFARRVVVNGSFSKSVSCTGPDTSFSVSVAGSNGVFVAGTATAGADAYGCELSCHSAGVAPMAVKLRGH